MLEVKKRSIPKSIPKTCEECEYFKECLEGKRKVCAFINYIKTR